MRIIGFAGSNSAQSINRLLVDYVLRQLHDHETELIDLRAHDVPMYGVDREQDSGIPPDIVALHERIRSADAVVISVAEHNGNLTAFFKNIVDWLSRNDLTFLRY